MRKTKYESFPENDRIYLEETNEINVDNVLIKNPNNPANLIDAILITFKLNGKTQ